MLNKCCHHVCNPWPNENTHSPKHTRTQTRTETLGKKEGKEGGKQNKIKQKTEKGRGWELEHLQSIKKMAFPISALLCDLS